MVRYLISMAVFIAGLVLTVLLAGAEFALWFLDIPSFIIVWIIPFLIACILFGFGKMTSAFSALSKKEQGKEKLPAAYLFFKSYGRITWAVGIVVAIMGIILMLGNLDDTASIGPTMALSLLSLFYSAIINVVILIPCTIFIKQKMVDLGGQK